MHGGDVGHDGRGSYDIAHRTDDYELAMHAVEDTLRAMGFDVQRLQSDADFTFRPGWTGFLATVPD